MINSVECLAIVSLKMDDSQLRYGDKPFSKWRQSDILNLWNLVFWSSDLCLNIILLLHTKFCIRTIKRWDIAKKTIFNMAAVRHFEFTKLYYFVMWPFWERESASANTKFHWKRMILGQDIAIKPFSKWQTSAILNFRKLVFWSCDLYLNMIMLLLTKFGVKRAINGRDIPKKQFSTWQPSAILDLLWRHHTSSGYSVLRS